MRLRHAQLSVSGPVRDHNEDSLAFWQPATPELIRATGSAAFLADGVGGESHGEVASHLAVAAAQHALQSALPGTPPARLQRLMFEAASRAVYDASMERPDGGRMATTLTIAFFRDGALHVAHVGDSRAYLVRRGLVRRLTADHCYAAQPVKLGLMHERQAMASPLRSRLTRSVGHEPVVHFDSCQEKLFNGDLIVQCTDGLYAFVVDDEIGDLASHHPPEEACRRLLSLAERRQGDDNISVQIIQVDEVETVVFYRGQPIHLDKPAPAVTEELAPGQLLDGRFEITGLVNRSGMAAIFKARDRRTGATVAIKAPLTQLEGDMAAFTRFEREEEIGRLLDHPYILKVLPVDGEKSRPYMVMEFLEGRTLDQLMQAHQPLPEPEAARIASRICEALEHMHRHNIVHRDLKPQNIMVCADGGIRILDFGIAKAARLRRMTFVGLTPTMGTPDYMAPEQVRGRRGDHRTDIYSLGAILYEMVTGRVPFEGESPYVIMNARTTGDPVAPRQLNGRLTPVMEEIILHALARKPEERYASAAQMKAELDDYELVPLIGRYKALKPSQPWKSKYRMVPLVLIFLALQLALFGLMFWYFSTHGKP